MKTKSTSQTARKLIRKAILFTITAFALCALPAVALAAGCISTTDWTGAVDNNWFNRSNWDNLVPDSSKNAYINNGGTADVNSNSAGAAACNLTLGVSAMQSGTVSVAGGTLAVTNEVEVGSFGKGTLTITNGGTVSAGLLTMAAQENSDSVGTVTVDGGTFTVNTRADVGGDNGVAGATALMTVKNGGSLTAGNLHVYKSGTLTGNGTVSTTNGITIDGTLVPSGTLTITGSLAFSGTTANMRCNVSSTSVDNAQVSGAATLNDAKLSVTLNGFFTGDFTLLHASTLNGQFGSYSFTYTGCLSPSIRYVNGTDVVLHVVSTCQ